MAPARREGRDAPGGTLRLPGPVPSARSVSGGALVGDTTAGTSQPIRFPEDLLRRHHLYVARTRMGKSTLMHHVVSHKLREKAAGRDGDAIVVVDPHADLVAGILEQVPESLIDKVRLIDLGDRSRAPGINLLDTRVFADRDRTADSVVRVARACGSSGAPGCSPSWSRRSRPCTRPTSRWRRTASTPSWTGCGCSPTTPSATRCWRRSPTPTFWSGGPGTSAAGTASTGPRPWPRCRPASSYYASSKRARAILGQPRSTIDLRETILDGGVLLVSTAQGSVGRDVAALVGASLLNLVDSVIREQESRVPVNSAGARWWSSTRCSPCPAWTTSPCSRNWASSAPAFILATQSLAKLEDLSPTMRDTILANVGCLAVFQVAGSDARQLVWEMGRDRVSEEDIVSLDVHHCYVRATVGTERMPAFSMMVRRPEDGDPGRRRAHPRRRHSLHPARPRPGLSHRGRRRRRAEGERVPPVAGRDAGGGQGGRGIRRAGDQRVPPAAGGKAERRYPLAGASSQRSGDGRPAGGTTAADGEDGE